jgi:hypothetical protein
MKFDSAKWRETRNERLLEWMRGDTDAVDFILQLAEVAEVWDDIIDRDKDFDPDRINRAFVLALLSIPSNPFYVAHGAYLRPLMMAGANAWMDSTELEKHKDGWAKVWAYALRDWYMELIPACANIIGGYAHMRDVSIVTRRFFQAETLQEYLDGLSERSSDRQGARKGDGAADRHYASCPAEEA